MTTGRFPAMGGEAVEQLNRIPKIPATELFHCFAGGVHLTSSPGARPSGRFTVRMEMEEMIDLRAGDVEAA
jgi:hypothetical protein